MYLYSVVRSALMALRLHLTRKRGFYVTVLAVVAVVLLLATYLFLLPPSSFPRGASVMIEKDTPLSEIGQTLEDRGLIRSAFLFKVAGRIMRADTRIQAGEYRFPEPQGLTTILYRIEGGLTGIPTTRVTFPEGITVREMTDILVAQVPGFNASLFRELAEPYEGYLFPDTYAIAENATPSDLVALMRETFAQRTKDISNELDASGVSLEDAVIMASLLEKEAKGYEDRRIVAGILWDRLEIGMALQVDAVFGYIKGIDTYHPSGDDLLINSPYNTYENRGLPPTAIGNPGLDALRAALTPTETPYLYYLSGTDGRMHYAETFEEHKVNKEKYLR